MEAIVYIDGLGNYYYHYHYYCCNHYFLLFMDGQLYYWWETNCKKLQACAQDCKKNRERKEVAEEGMSSRHEK